MFWPLLYLFMGFSTHNAWWEKQSEICLKLCPQVIASNLGSKPRILTQHTLETHRKSSTHLMALKKMRARISLCSGVSLIFPLRQVGSCPKALQAYWKQKGDSDLITFAINFGTNRSRLQICIRYESGCEHCFSLHATPCQKVKLHFMKSCSKICWLPES